MHVQMLRRPVDRLVSAFAYRLHGLAWANTWFNRRKRALIEKVAPSPILFYALHSCGVQARLLAGATSMVEGVLLDAPNHTEELRGMACSSARLEEGIAMLKQVSYVPTSSSSSSHLSSWFLSLTLYVLLPMVLHPQFSGLTPS